MKTTRKASKNAADWRVLGHGAPADDLDAKVIALCWDAETIEREAGQPVYRLWPPLPTDSAILANVGARLATALRHAVIVWRNTPEET